MDESKAQKLAKALKEKEEGKVMDQEDKLAQREAVRLEKLAKKEAAAKKAALKNQAAEDVKKIDYEISKLFLKDFTNMFYIASSKSSCKQVEGLKGQSTN